MEKVYPIFRRAQILLVLEYPTISQAMVLLGYLPKNHSALNYMSIISLDIPVVTSIVPPTFFGPAPFPPIMAGF